MLQLRHYQEKAIEKILEYALDGKEKGLLVIPTGCGKSLMIAELCRRIILDCPYVRIAVCVHSKELVRQNHEEIMSIWPDCPAGIYSAGLKRREHAKQIVFCGIQSVYNKAKKLGHTDIIIVDECFVSGTKIRTSSGEKDIDTVRCGDIVVNACGVGVVESISAKTSKEIYKLEFDDGEIIECTGSHPFFTEKGWVKAKELENGTHTFSAEGLRSLWENIQTLDKIQRGRENTFGLPRTNMESAALLLSILCEEIEKPNEQPSIKIENEGEIKRNKTQAYQAWRERAIATFAAIGIASCFGRGVGIGISSGNKNAKRNRLSNLLQDRHSTQRKNDRDRTRWKFSRFIREASSGCEKNRIACFPRLVNISCHEYESPRVVFNLQISGHPSYFANGRLVHNCHTMSRKSESRWGEFFADMKTINPNVQIIGLTATPYRLDSGNLVPHTFNGIAYEYSVIDAIKEGYLCEIVSAPVETHLKTQGVHKRGGEFIAGELERAVDRDPLTRACVDEIIKFGADRRSWIVFASGNTHAAHITDILIEHGINAKCVTEKTPPHERDQIVADHKSGALKCLVNNMIFTTGYNNPMLDLIACMRPTQSEGLWVQICGRGMRLYPDKQNCLLLDFGRNLDRHGPIDKIRGKNVDESSGDGEAPLKQCPSCFEPVHAAVKNCPACGYEFPIGELDITVRASTAAVLSTQIVPKEYKVLSVTYKRNIGKDGKPDSMMVTYNTLSGQIREWVFFDHPLGSTPYIKAIKWAGERGVNLGSAGYYILDLDKALTISWPQPMAIEAIKDGKYYKIKKVIFSY